MPDQLIESIIKKLISNDPTLTKVEINGILISDEDIKRLADALSNNNRVLALELTGNEISDEGACAIAEALKNNSTIRTLDLSWNKIGNKGAKALASVLRENDAVCDLNLYRNQIGFEGADAISEMIKVNVSVSALNLGENSMGGEGAIALSRGIKENATLRKLNLFFNGITDEGIAELAKAVNVNDGLRHLDVRSNAFSEVGRKVLSEMLENNFGLVSLEYRDPDIGMNKHTLKYERERYLYERNKKAGSYLGLLLLLRDIALSKQLPEDKECAKFSEEFSKLLLEIGQERIIGNAGDFRESDEDIDSFLKRISSPRSVKDLCCLGSVIFNCLCAHLGSVEFERINKKLFGIKSTSYFLMAWNVELDIVEGGDVGDVGNAERFLIAIQNDHPLKGRAHAHAAHLYTTKLNDLARKEENAFLEASEVADVLAFLHHCAMARCLRGGDDEIPKELETQVLKCLGNYIIGKGWVHKKVEETDMYNKGISCDGGLIEWLKRCFWKLASEKNDFKVITRDVSDLSGSQNTEEDNQGVDVVLLVNVGNDTSGVFRQKIYQQYPRSLVAEAPSFLSFEERPFQRFLKSCLIGNLEFVGNFEHQIKEIRDRYISEKTDLSHEKNEAKKLFLKEIKGANQFKLLFLFNFVKNNPLCDFIHEQRNERWDRSRISLFRHIARDDGDKRQTKSTQSNRWWNTATFSQIGEKIKSEWVKNERKGDVIGLDREALLDFDFGNLFKSQCYSKASYRPTLRI